MYLLIPYNNMQFVCVCIPYVYLFSMCIPCRKFKRQQVLLGCLCVHITCVPVKSIVLDVKKVSFMCNHINNETK